VVAERLVICTVAADTGEKFTASRDNTKTNAMSRLVNRLAFIGPPSFGRLLTFMMNFIL
jgi:hypothetical protein